MTFGRIVVAVLVIAALAGCAASGPKFSEMQKSGGVSSLQSNLGRIYFYRENSMFGAAVRPDIKLDGNRVGDSIPGGFFFVDVVPGSHAVTTSTEVDRTATFTLAKAETKYIKTSVSLGVLVGHVIPELVDPSEAQRALGDLSYTGQSSNSIASSHSQNPGPSSGPASDSVPPVAARVTLAPGPATTPIVGAEFRQRIIEQQPFFAMTRGGRTLEITLSDGNVNVHNVELGGRGSGNYQVDNDRSLLCLSSMRPSGFEPMSACYQMLRVDDQTVELLSTTSRYSLRYSVSSDTPATTPVPTDNSQGYKSSTQEFGSGEVAAGVASRAAPQPLPAVPPPTSTPTLASGIQGLPRDAMVQVKYQGLADAFAARSACTSHPHTELKLLGADAEIYSVPCDSGDRWLIKCEANSCHVMQ